MVDLDATERCRRCLEKYNGTRDCPNCPSDAELFGTRQEIPGQMNMFDALMSDEEEEA